MSYASRGARAAIYGFALIGWIIVAGVAGCCSSNPVEPKTNVSVNDYRSTIAKIESALLTQILPAVQAIHADDLAQERPRHGEGWYDAKERLIQNCATLCSDTLTGSSAGDKK